MKEIAWCCPRCRISLQRNGSDFRCNSCKYLLRSRPGYWDAGPPEALTFPPPRRALLAELEKSHFWFQPRDELMGRILKRNASNGRRIIEFGCGTGRFLSVLKTVTESITAVDAYDQSVQAAAAKDSGAVLLRCDVLSVPLSDETFDLAVSLDVLEHVDPLPFLAEAHRLVRPGGMLVLSVPASPRLWSPTDEAARHRCRYTRNSLVKELEQTGWALSGSTHYQCVLYPLMVASRRLLQGQCRMEREPPRWINSVLGWVNSFEVHAFGGFQLPWGSTLIAWARKG